MSLMEVSANWKDCAHTGTAESISPEEIKVVMIIFRIVYLPELKRPICACFGEKVNHCEFLPKNYCSMKSRRNYTPVCFVP
jgi:hypothetical protein